METSVGITCADVYCGTVGSMERMEYAAIGSEVNMAARLMGKAKGRLLVSESAYIRLPESDQASLQALAPMMVKGRSEPLQAYAHVAPLEVRSFEGMQACPDISSACQVSLNALLDSISGTVTCEAVRREGSFLHEGFAEVFRKHKLPLSAVHAPRCEASARNDDQG
jgi:hypothetical protein